MVNVASLVKFSNTGLNVGDWSYFSYLQSVPDYLPLNNATTSYLQASYPALAALLPTQFKLVLTSNTAVTFPAAVQWYTVAYGNGIWVAGSYTTSNTARSTDNGSTWSAGGTIAAGAARGLAYGAGFFFATSGGTNHASSPDGVTWTARTTPVSVTGIVFGGGIFAAVGANTAASSLDGITWTTRTIPAGSWDTITYGNGTFVAIDRSGGSVTTVVTSVDGVNWISRSLPNAVSCYSITYGNGIFLLLPYNAATTVYTSPDGITWTARSSTNHGVQNFVTFGNGVFAAYASSAVYISTDGTTWAATAAASPFSGSGAIGAGAGGVFVAVNNANSVTNLRFSAEVSTTVFTLPVVPPVTGTYSYVRAT